MNSFNADVVGYMFDVYVQWSTNSDGSWEGSFDYNADWIKRDDVNEVLEPGRYKLIEEATEYEIDVDEVIPQGEEIYRVHFQGVGGKPLERTWNRARELHSSLSWDEQVMQKIESGYKTTGEQWVEDLERKEASEGRAFGCFLVVVLIVVVLVIIDYFFDIF